MQNFVDINMHHNGSSISPGHISTAKRTKISTYYMVLLLVSGSLSVIIGSFEWFHLSLLMGVLYVGISPGVNSLIFFVLYSFIQNIFLICFSPELAPSDMTLLILYKEMIVYFSVFVFFIRHGGGNFNSDRLSGSLLILIALIFIFNLYVSKAPLFVKLLSLRQILIPYVCLFFGYAIVLSIDKFKSFIRFYIILVMITCIIGILIYMQDTINFWDGINFPIYMLKKNGIPYSGTYENFYSHDLGFMVKRFVSFLADPVAMAHMIGLALLFLFAMYKKRNGFIKTIIFICAMLCVSKSLAFLLCTTLIVWFYLNIEDKNKRRLFVMFAIISLFGMFTVANIYVDGLEANTASGNHLKSMIYALNNNSLFGNGLGSAGFVVAMTGNDIEAEVTESFMATLIAQIGVAGAIVFYAYFFVKINQLIIRYRKFKDKYTYVAIIILTDVILESIVSGSSIAMVGTGLYFIIPGMIYRNSHLTTATDEKRNKKVLIPSLFSERLK